MTDEVRLTSDLVDILDNRVHMCLYNGWADRINYCLAITKRHEQQVALLWDSLHNAGLPEQCDGEVVKSMWSFGYADNDDRIRREISVAPPLFLSHSLSLVNKRSSSCCRCDGVWTEILSVFKIQTRNSRLEIRRISTI